MNALVRKFRRWYYGRRCRLCNRKFMHRHKCYELKDIQDEVNRIHNERVDKIEISGGHDVGHKPTN